MTTLSRLSILLLFTFIVSSCCIRPDEEQQTPDKLSYEGEKQVEYSVNHFVTLMMTASPLAVETGVPVTYLGLQKDDVMAKRVDSVFESRLNNVDDLRFSPYKLKNPKSWTLVAKKIKRLKGRYVAYMYLLNPEGTPVWKYKMYVKYFETADDAWRVRAGVVYDDKEQEQFDDFIVDYLQGVESDSQTPVANK